MSFAQRQQQLYLTYQVQYPNSMLSIALRGDSFGLNWSSGINMPLVDATQQLYALTLPLPNNISSSFIASFKTLVDDSTWQVNYFFRLFVKKNPIKKHASLLNRLVQTS